MFKAKELRGLSNSEIEEKLLNLKKQLFELKVGARTDRIEKPHKIKETKKDIARILTLLREKR